ncbi:outer membrane beta-barrel family protein [Allomuricauda sp. SCSIO 65647]|uniref:outer membrane beta-barrel family protein n=1 Tax=Allomuricauda sp. SCSIO 65647 TaxID=2908843 RepID=UPI001F1F3DA2|nr:outer membrane beta-barrel family protein [Muricauda sp. SCSIO 65647]UJH66377.1 TonB-dependent receptor family protein [Muricauda sp. SCSIO 65647]
MKAIAPRTKCTVLIVIMLVFCFVDNVVIAQQGNVTYTGKIIDKNSGQPVAYATVIIGDTATQQAIAGATTLEDGTFSIATNTGDHYIEVSFIGFEKLVLQPPVSQGRIVDLGAIEIAEDAQQLEEVVVEGEVSQTVFKLDKRVFNVGKDLSSTGASALEVLNNVPSVNVNIEGQISLRGSQGVQVLINGKPSILTSDENNALGTITADMIDRIEVITNPSAKYDAEGTSGIINIVIKKEEKRGFNGSVSVNTGAPNNHSLGVSLNRRTEKFNLFTQLGAGYRELPNEITVRNTDLNTGTTILSNGEEFRNETFYNFILGTDYYFSPTSVLTLSGNFALEIEDQPSATSFAALDSSGNLTSEWERTEVTDARNPKFQYELQYKKDFEDDEDHDLLFSALGNFFGKDQSSEFLDITLSGEDRNAEQTTRTDFKESVFTFKLDYTKPFSDEFSIETGAQYILNDVSNDFEVQNLEGGQFVTDPGLTNIFEFDQDVLGIYGTAAYEGKKWGIKAGMRLENTNLGTLLVNTDETNDQNYTNLFPSVHTSYKFSEKVSLQAGYSKRIYRPRLWDLNPFFNIRNNFNIRQGNPNLMPEFTDSYEMTGIFFIGKTSLNLGVYHRYTTDIIERISTFENNVNIRRPENIGTNNAWGMEFNTKYSPTNWLTFNVDFNYNTFAREGTFDDTIIDFSAEQWSSKLLTKIKLPWDIDFETTGNYQSAFQTVQGEIDDIAFLDFGVRKKIMKGKGVLNLSVRDAFASRIRENQIIQSDFEVFNRSFRARFVAFGFSYGFGKGEAMQFSGAKRM